jgi:hypothetical protein
MKKPPSVGRLVFETWLVARQTSRRPVGPLGSSSTDCWNASAIPMPPRVTISQSARMSSSARVGSALLPRGGSCPAPPGRFVQGSPASRLWDECQGIVEAPPPTPRWEEPCRFLPDPPPHGQVPPNGGSHPLLLNHPARAIASTKSPTGGQPKLRPTRQSGEEPHHAEGVRGNRWFPRRGAGAEPLQREPRQPASSSKGHAGALLTEQGKLPSQSALRRRSALPWDSSGPLQSARLRVTPCRGV